MHHSRMASLGGQVQGMDMEGGPVGAGMNNEETAGGPTRCYVCSHRGHKELVRSLWLGENVVLSGSYDHSIKARPARHMIAS